MKIRIAELSDIPAMVSLSAEKRGNYEQAQPLFWKGAKNADALQKEWFSTLLNKDEYILLVAEEANNITGFIIGQIIQAPDVYDPGGLTLMIDDFCVNSPDLWITTGKELLESVEITSRQKGATQIVAVCGHHDKAKKKFFNTYHFSIASEWYVKGVKAAPKEH